MHTIKRARRHRNDGHVQLPPTTRQHELVVEHRLDVLVQGPRRGGLGLLVHTGLSGKAQDPQLHVKNRGRPSVIVTLTVDLPRGGLEEEVLDPHPGTHRALLGVHLDRQRRRVRRWLQGVRERSREPSHLWLRLLAPLVGAGQVCHTRRGVAGSVVDGRPEHRGAGGLRDRSPRDGGHRPVRDWIRGPRGGRVRGGDLRWIEPHRSSRLQGSRPLPDPSARIGEPAMLVAARAVMPGIVVAAVAVEAAGCRGALASGGQGVGGDLDHHVPLPVAMNGVDDRPLQITAEHELPLLNTVGGQPFHPDGGCARGNPHVEHRLVVVEGRGGASQGGGEVAPFVEAGSLVHHVLGRHGQVTDSHAAGHHDVLGHRPSGQRPVHPPDVLPGLGVEATAGAKRGVHLAVGARSRIGANRVRLAFG